MSNIFRELDANIRAAEGFVEKVKANAHRRPWVFTSCGMGLCLVVGLLI